ncbi:MAG TPA: DUF962 domain-containing protein [Myxococcaceae bacterium]|nr:DUF962 domain-containing protein [Myxococcaceae bacterium]
MSAKRIESFEDFWPYYLGEHRRAGTKALHFIGTTGALTLIILSLLLRDWPLVLAALLCGYGFAWIGHFLIEKNRPATFQYPLWSLAADWKMWGLILTGRIRTELRRLNV